MALQQAVGIAVHFSAALPATHDAAGFNGLTYKKIGFLSEVPDLDGEYDVATFDNLETGEEVKFADVHRAGDGTLKVGFDSTDEGQALLETRKGQKGSFKFVLKGGQIYYRTAIVQSIKPTGISTGNVVMADIAVAFEKTTVRA